MSEERNLTVVETETTEEKKDNVIVRTGKAIKGAVTKENLKKVAIGVGIGVAAGFTIAKGLIKAVAGGTTEEVTDDVMETEDKED